ncbi:Transcriptional regulator of ribosomal biogenesis protein [Mortierella sp. NVP41]|nr:Transcriptional regulator of ribosomal biogenesis protein [Mortierella sp. NVP41]
MPASIPTPSINISASSSSANNPRHHNHSTASTLGGTSFHGHGYPSLSNSVAASSPFNPEVLAAATALRRPSLVLSIGSFHSAQLRRPSFFAPFPYSQSPQLSDPIQDYSSSPRRGDVYQRELEDNYCKNFSCCGLTLGDLHALLQHYEEAHVRFEADDDNGHPVPAGFTDEDGWSTGSDSGNDHHHSQSNGRHNSHGYNNNNRSNSTTSAAAANAAAAATVAALTASHQQQNQKLTPLSFLAAKRKNNNGVSLSDIYSEDSGLTPDDAVSAFPNSILRTTAQAEFSNLASKKRDLSAYSTSFDTHSPMAKKISNFQNVTLTSSTNPLTSAAAAKAGTTTTTTSAFSNALSSAITGSSTGGTTAKSQEELLSTVTDYLQQAIEQGLLPDVGEVGSPAYLKAAEDLMRKREELVSIMESIGKSGSSGADKPYRCTVSGCDKAYKNPNGLKYHNQHGHCSASGLGDAEGPESKPYVCSFMECGKRYKNLNGLKYHIEHSHPNLTAALKAHQAGLTSHPLLMNGAFSNNQAAAMTLAASLSTVEASPMMMAAINAIAASAANQNNNNNSNNNNTNNSNSNGNRISPLVDQTPESSPNTSPSPTMQPAAAAAAAAAAATAAITTTLLSSLSAYRNTTDPNIFSTDVTPMTSPVLSRATLPGLSPLSIQTSSGAMMMTGLVTPSSLSPTLASAGAPKSPTSGVSQVSTLTAALAAVSVEHQRHQQRQQQQQQQ